MALSVTDDSLLSSGVILNLVGGKHSPSQFIDSKAKDAKDNDSDTEMLIETEEDLDFIDNDALVVNSSISFYQQMENRQEIFLPPDDVVMEPDKDKNCDSDDELKNVHSANGLCFTKEDLKRVNIDIDKNMIRSNGVEGYCRYFAILNGLYFVKTGL